MKEQKILNLGWCVARITTQDNNFPKLRLEIFSPDSSDADGRYTPRSDITLNEKAVTELADFLESYSSNRQAVKNTKI